VSPESEKDVSKKPIVKKVSGGWEVTFGSEKPSRVITVTDLAFYNSVVRAVNEFIFNAPLSASEREELRVGVRNISEGQVRALALAVIHRALKDGKRNSDANEFILGGCVGWADIAGINPDTIRSVYLRGKSKKKNNNRGLDSIAGRANGA